MNTSGGHRLLYCGLLALQFGLQPIISNRFTGTGVSKSSIIIATEVFKILISAFSILTGPKAEIDKIKENWSLVDSLKVAALPATLYAIQNLFVQHGYMYLDSMTFNLLNQTKVSQFALDLTYVLISNLFPPFFRRYPQHSGCILSWVNDNPLYK